MHDKPKGAGADDRASAALDVRDQGVVLIHVLTLHPAHLRLVELVREVTAGSVGFEDADRFQRASQELVGVGLLPADQRLRSLDIRPHECRHSYVTHLRAAGVNDADLAQIAGHRVETMLARYTHAVGTGFKEVRAKIG